MATPTPLGAIGLFISVTEGISWVGIAAICEGIGLAYFYTFLCSVFFVYFSVLNIVTGVFVMTRSSTFWSLR